jgi:sigma-E factor negative regulatory protein RseA
MTDKASTRKPNLTRDDEPVSALVDGELDARGAEFVIRRVAGDDELGLRWQRFHVVRACLRGEFSGSGDLVPRVREALAGEAAPVTRRGAGTRLLRLAGGGAVAAGVAMMAVVGLGNRVDQQATPTDVTADAPGFVSETTALDRQFNPRAVPAGFGGAEREAAADPETRSSRARINRYVIRHSQVAGGNGFISFTPVLTAPNSVQLVKPDHDRRESGRERGE